MLLKFIGAMKHEAVQDHMLIALLKHALLFAMVLEAVLTAQFRVEKTQTVPYIVTEGEAANKVQLMQQQQNN